MGSRCKAIVSNNYYSWNYKYIMYFIFSKYLRVKQKIGFSRLIFMLEVHI